MLINHKVNKTYLYQAKVRANFHLQNNVGSSALQTGQKLVYSTDLHRRANIMPIYMYTSDICNYFWTMYGQNYTFTMGIVQEQN